MGFLQFSIWVWGSAWRPLGPPELRYNALRSLGHWLRHLCHCIDLLTCKWPSYQTFILVSGDQTFALNDYYYQLLSIGSFPKKWPLKQVFRGHFGPQVKLSGWNTAYKINTILLPFQRAFPFEGDIKDCRTPQPCVMSFFLFLSYLFLISPCPHSRGYLQPGIYRTIVQINSQTPRSNSSWLLVV